MEQVFKNQYVELNVDVHRKYAEIVYCIATANMTEDEYRSVVSITVTYFDQWLKSSINRILWDTRENFYPIIPELQLWTVKQFEQFKTYTYKTATVVSTELIAALSIEQTIEEFDFEDNQRIENRFFDNIDNARNWLFS